jgi:major membrane immunogen (membrane-anchored lipoprotein)
MKPINPNKIKVRDPLMVRLITGATKSGKHLDRKRQANKHACRRPVRLYPS